MSLIKKTMKPAVVRTGFPNQLKPMHGCCDAYRWLGNFPGGSIWQLQYVFSPPRCGHLGEGAVGLRRGCIKWSIVIIVLMWRKQLELWLFLVNLVHVESDLAHKQTAGNELWPDNTRTATHWNTTAGHIHMKRAHRTTWSWQDFTRWLEHGIVRSLRFMEPGARVTVTDQCNVRVGNFQISPRLHYQLTPL